jgi:hypothetical protein
VEEPQPAAVCYLVKQDLDNIAWWYWLDDSNNDDIPLLPVQNPYIYCSVECRIHHEFDLWMRSFRPTVEYAFSRMNIGM